MATNEKTSWFMQADYIQACNCDFGCPCEFSAPPTRGFCEGVGAWKIGQGRYGSVPLDGLGLAFAAHWPKALHEGNGTAVIYVDQQASPEQRKALLEIGQGKAGGLPFEILATTISTFLEPQFAPFEFELNGANSKVRVGTQMQAATEPIKNPVTGEPEQVRINHVTGFIFQEAECLASKEMKVSTGNLQFSWPSKAAFVTQVRYGN